MASGGIILPLFRLLTFSAIWQMARLSSMNTTNFGDLLVTENCTLSITDFKSVHKQFKKYIKKGKARLVDIRITGIAWSESSEETAEVFDPNLWSWVAKGSEFLTQMPIDFHILSFGLSRLAMKDLGVNMAQFPNGCVDHLTFEHQRRLVTKELLHLTEDVLGNNDLICRSTYSRRLWLTGNRAGVEKTCCTRGELRSGRPARNECDIEQATDHKVEEFSEMFVVMVILSFLLPLLMTACVMIWWHGNKHISCSADFAEHFTHKLEKWVNFRVRANLHSAEAMPSGNSVGRRVSGEENENTILLGEEPKAKLDKAGKELTLWIAENDLVPYKGSVSLWDISNLHIMRGVGIKKIQITILLLLYFVLVVYWLTYFSYEKETFWRLNSTDKILFNLYGIPYSWLWTDKSFLPYYFAALLVFLDVVIFVSLACCWVLEFERALSRVSTAMEKKVFRVVYHILVIYSYIPLYSIFNSIIYVFGGLIISIDKTLPWLTGVMLVLFFIRETRKELIQTYTRIKREMFELREKETPHRAIHITDAEVIQANFENGNRNSRAFIQVKERVIYLRSQEFIRPVLFTRYQETKSARSGCDIEMGDITQNRPDEKEGTPLDQSGILLEFMLSKQTLLGVCEKIKPIRASIQTATLNLGAIVFFLVLVVVTMTVFHPNAATTEARLVMTSIPPLLIVLIRLLAGKMTTEAENQLAEDIIKTDIQRMLLRNRPKYFVEVERCCWIPDQKTLRTEVKTVDTPIRQVNIRTKVKGSNPLQQADEFVGTVDLYYKDGTTPLMKAAEKNHFPRVTSLIKAGADVNLRDEEWAKTAMMYASEGGHSNVVGKLIKAGADVDIQDKSGRTALMWASMEGHQEVAAKLIKARADLDIMTESGKTALVLASMEGRQKVAAELINAGADMNSSESGMTALIFALKKGHMEVAAELIEAGAEVNIKDNRDGRTAMMYASMMGHSKVVEKLIKVPGADVDIKDMSGMTALIFALKKGHMEVAAELIEAGAEVNIKDNRNGRTAMMYASRNGHSKVVEKLVKVPGADVDIKDMSGMTALILASMNGHKEVVAKLIEAHAEVNIKDDRGKTALMIASENGHNEVVTELILLGADVNIRDKEGMTALMCASKHSRQEVAAQLIKAGAVMNIQDKDGKTAHDWAKEGRGLSDEQKEKGYREIVEMLQSAAT